MLISWTKRSNDFTNALNSLCEIIWEKGEISIIFPRLPIFLLSNKLYFFDIPILVLWTQPSSISDLTSAPDHHQSSAYYLPPAGPNFFLGEGINQKAWLSHKYLTCVVPLILHFRNYFSRSMTHCNSSVYTPIKILWIVAE